MRVFARALRAAGVREVCISPGSRSTATALAVVQAGLRPWVVTDERTAGFFALGIGRASGCPAALLCTSGTAAANYLPAVVEASMAEVPLVVLTADRPPELRDCHAAQTIDQVRLYGTHARWSVDAPAPGAGVDLEAYFRTLAQRAVAVATEAPRGPVHVNLPMREPLLDVADERGRCATPHGEGAEPLPRVYAASGAPSSEAVAHLAAALAVRPRGVVVCGPGAARDGATAAALARLAERLGWPLLADPLSGLRFGPHDRASIVDAYDVLLQGGALDAAWHPEAVLQFGTPAVSAALPRFLAAARAPHYVVVAPPGRWPDPLCAATDLVRADPRALAEALAAAVPAAPSEAARAWRAAWCATAGAARAALDGLLARETTLFEGVIAADVARALGDGATLHVGNSLPVRALDTFVGGASAALRIDCNRGANGIDGVVATALGTAALAERPTALVVGDLSFLHDLGALQVAARHRVPLLVVVVNNDGGGIFSFLPQAGLDADTFETLFGTPHGLDLGGAVAMCGGAYVRATNRVALGAAVDAWRAAPTFAVVEAPVERAASRALHARLVAEACRAAGRATPAAGGPARPRAREP
ncbi:MAG: 2-succinyl-5-enolpyruvyl-6-hydroxy-3-cyclohexene-1-carboxylic-acid synthase [Deltaproteobacteria bacterium]|nr:2-succinyl-5-enolpyruvyl-6-hydroxy-3-cyclohexene-1-carboxylic-acid synthase [Deltaproteobacteria bacterium]